MMIYHQASSQTQSAESSTNPSTIPSNLENRLRRRALHKASKGPNKKPIITTMNSHENYHHNHHLYHQYYHQYHRQYLHACSLCPKKFTTSQALGGHQNAHRKERHQNKRLLLEFQEQIAENDIQSLPKINSDHHHGHHHDGGDDDGHHHHDQHHQYYHQNYQHGHVIPPNPLRAFFPLTDYQQVDVGPTYQTAYGLQVNINPTINNPNLTKWVNIPSPLPPPPLPSPAYVLSNWKAFHPSYPGLVAQVARPINPNLVVQPQAKPLFPSGFGGNHHGSTNAAVNTNQSAARVKQVTMKEAKAWGLDLKLAL